MIVSQDLKRMLPDWYEGLYETDLLMTIEQSLIDDLATQINRAQSNLYISTADSETLAVYENMLRITRQNGDTLDMRRFRILTRLASQKPYTKRYFQEVLNAFGAPVTVKYFYNDYALKIESNFEQSGQMSDLEYLVRTVVPANILPEISNRLEMNDLNEEIYLGLAVTVCEFNQVTQDFVYQVGTQQGVYLASGQTDGSFVSVMHDFKQDMTTTALPYLGAGQTMANFRSVTQDFIGISETTQQVIQSSGNVVANFITINKGSE